MKKSVFIILILTTLFGLIVGGCFVIKNQEKAKYKDTPLTLAIYEYLDSGNTANLSHDLEQIIQKYVPIGTPIKEALEVFKANHFDCGGPKKKLNSEIDEEYGCGIQNIILSKTIFQSTLGVWIHVKQDKISSYDAYHNVHAL